jgi:hypothetical protein
MAWKNKDTQCKRVQCKACIMGKGKRLPSPPNEIRRIKSLAVAHIDIWRPARTASLGGARYFLFCYDDFTSKIDLICFKEYFEAFDGMRTYITKVERQSDCKVKTIRSDNVRNSLEVSGRHTYN